jgi:hypothetical protein
MPRILEKMDMLTYGNGLILGAKGLRGDNISCLNLWQVLRESAAAKLFVSGAGVSENPNPAP